MTAAGRSRGAEGLERRARWLTERAVPFAGALRAMLAGHQHTTRETWWLEGVNRGMGALGRRVEMRDGFLRLAEIATGALPIELQLLHVLR